MDRNGALYQTYLGILKRELVCAMGCTEPIAIAFCAAKARAALGLLPERMQVIASGNIIKNVKSVVVPNTDGRRGIEAAAALGALGGDADRALEVVAGVSEETRAALGGYLARTPIEVLPAASELPLDITLRAFAGAHEAEVRVVNEHTNIVLLRCDGTTLLRHEVTAAAEDNADYDLLTVDDIYDFAMSAEPADVAPLLNRQIALNSDIADEGMSRSYGANIGKVLLRAFGSGVSVRARARAAAASDARMNGCEKPVVICSGSGNQGITASIPVIEYARELGLSRETLYRALLLSDLCTLHQKSGIGRLSAYCGAVCAGAGAGAGIAYLKGGDLDAIRHTIVNALAITSGIICDGAKSSCAAKIAAAVDAGILGYEMYADGQQFYGGDGIVVKGVENTIRNVGTLGRVGMKETDRVIIDLMTRRDKAE